MDPRAVCESHSPGARLPLTGADSLCALKLAGPEEKKPAPIEKMISALSKGIPVADLSVLNTTREAPAQAELRPTCAEAPWKKPYLRVIRAYRSLFWVVAIADSLALESFASVATSSPNVVERVFTTDVRPRALAREVALV
jgi:hypothetical protein